MIKALNILLKCFTAIKPNETLCMGYVYNIFVNVSRFLDA